MILFGGYNMRKKIGLRTFKTSISIFICLLFFIILKSFEYIPGCPENFAYTWYNPFFAGIATAYSIHSSKEVSIRQAKNRCIASIIGGGIGIVLVSLYTLFGGHWPNLQSINLSTLNFVLPYILISIISILVILIGIVFKQQQAVFVSILTFLSVTVNPNVNVGAWEWQFGLNRILSTIIGVGIALSVNLFLFPHRYKNKNLLFCVGIDDILLKETDRFKGFLHYKLNHLNRIKVSLTLFTTRTPTTFMGLLEDVKIEHPIICMSGAALYDAKNLKYLATEPIEQCLANEIRDFLSIRGITPFINQIEEDVLFTYCEHINHPGEQAYADSKRNAAYCSYILGKAPQKDVLYFLLIEEVNHLEQTLEELSKLPMYNELLIQVYEDFDHYDGKYRYVKIYSRKVIELNVLKNYCNSLNLQRVGIATSPLATHLLLNCEYALTLKNSPQQVKALCNEIISSEAIESMFNKVEKIYHSNLSKSSKV